MARFPLRLLLSAFFAGTHFYLHPADVASQCQVSLLEKARLAPAGSTSVSSFLVKGADALVAGGRQRIFTPMFFTLARKPL
jgi:hypothetical protein